MKKLMSFLLAAAMIIVSVTGCSNTPATESGSTSSGDGQGSSQSQGLEPITENLEGPIVEEPITLKGFVKEATEFGQNYDDLTFWKNLSEETNIQFEFERVPSQGWAEKLNLKLTSGTLPDFIGGGYSCVTADDISKYANTAFLDFSGLLENNAPNLKALMKEDPQIEKVMTSVDGGMYSFCSIYTEVEQNVGPMPYINTKWLDTLGLDMPETTDELYEVLKAFKTRDPNGNGKNDEIPLSAMDKTLGSILSEVVSGAFGFPYYVNYIAIDDNGKTYFSPATDGYKEAIKYIQKLYTEGLIDSEIFSIDRSKMTAKSNQGRDNQVVGVVLGGVQEQNFVGEDSIDDYEPLLPVAGPDGDRGAVNENAAYMMNNFVITTANKYPEETVRLVDRMYSPMWSLQEFQGVIGESIELSDDGKRYQYMEPENGVSIDQMRFQSSPVFMPYCMNAERLDELMVPDPLMQENTWNNCRKFEPYLDTYTPNPPTWPMSVNDAKEVARMKVDMQKLIEEKRGNWVSGKGDIDAEWEDYVNTLKSMGMDKYVEYHQKAYDTFNK